MKRRGHKNNAGLAQLTALIFITVSVLVITAVTSRHLQQRVLVDHHQITQTAFDGAEAALNLSLAQMRAGNSGVIGLQGWTPVYNADKELVLPPFDSNAYTPVTLSSMPEVEHMSYVVNWANDGRDSNGDGTVDSNAERNIFSIHSAARFRGDVRRVEAVYQAGGQGVSVWDNAIFAGNGANGRLINGNVTIFGSVHLLGNNLNLGDPAVTTMEMSGNSLMGNNYSTLDSALKARIPALEKKTINGVAGVETLNAKLRVKRGLVSLSGSSSIGQPNNNGNKIKETVDGTYVTNGWTGNKVSGGGRGTPNNGVVNSDNGHTAVYDLGDSVSMPMLSDPWRDLDGSTVVNPGTGNPYTHEDYFSQVLLASPTVANDGVYNKNMVLNSTSFYWNATTNTELTGTAAVTAGAALNPNHDYIWFNAGNNPKKDAGVLKVNGQIRINGTLTITGNDKNYSGRAAILTTGNVDISANLLTCNNGNVNDYALSFPENNCLGVMSKGNISLGVSSQKKIMGAFYAQGTVNMDKQTQTVGAVVGNYFSMGNQVPDIFQVPSLVEFLPYGMIGNTPTGGNNTLSLLAWREMGV